MYALLLQVMRRRLGPGDQLAQGPDPSDDIFDDALHALDDLDLRVAAVWDGSAVIPHRPRTERQAVGEPDGLVDQTIRLRLEGGRVPVHAPPEVGRDLAPRRRDTYRQGVELGLGRRAGRAGPVVGVGEVRGQGVAAVGELAQQHGLEAVDVPLPDLRRRQR
ncbi:hypothetical protein PG984_007685 [Apiospora sp. TS-2023a]